MPSAETLVQGTDSTRSTFPVNGAALPPVGSDTAAPGRITPTQPESRSIAACMASRRSTSSGTLTGAALCLQIGRGLGQRHLQALHLGANDMT
jgi:hypothetical protein